MCLGRVKGTRVAKRQVQRTGGGTAGCNGCWERNGGRRREGGRGRGEGGEETATRGMDALARHAPVIETNSIPRIVSDARTRRGDRFGTGNPRYPEFEKAMGSPESDGFSPTTAGVESAGDRIPGIRNLYYVAFANTRICTQDPPSLPENLLEI